jgi:hypothetical protein
MRKENLLSEVARLKRQIELECEAMRQAMDGFRVTAAHDIINHQYDSIGNIQFRALIYCVISTGSNY